MDLSNAQTLMAGSAAVGAAGSLQQGFAGRGAALYNAKIAEQNASLATQNAEWTGAEGEQKAGIAGLQTRATVGAQKAGQAGNNVDVNSGSAAAVRQGTTEAGMLNQMNIRSNAARQAYGFEVQSAGDMAQSRLDKSQAGNDVTAGFTNALTSGLKGAALAEEFGGGGGDSYLDSSTQTSRTAAVAQDVTNDGGQYLASNPTSNWQPYMNNNPGTLTS